MSQQDPRSTRCSNETALAGGNTPPTSNQLTDLSDSFGLTVVESCQAIALFSSHSTHKDLRIADTGTSCHMTCSDDSMFNCVEIN
jgi:hypothetical protein